MKRPLRISAGRTVDPFGRAFTIDLEAIRRKRDREDRNARIESPARRLSIQPAPYVKPATY